MGSYFPGENEKEKKQQVVFGVKSCDLKSLVIQDYIFLEGVCVDPVYKELRESTIFISTDCTDCKEISFCTALGINPYPEKYFDLNFSKVDHGYLIEVGSEKGEALLSKYGEFFSTGINNLIAKRDHIRQKVYNQVCEQAKDFPAKEKLYPAVKTQSESQVYKEEAKKCVECGACVFSCPTCHCFYLYDEKKGNEYVRTRIWDACQYQNFMQEAGGANPLRWRYERLRNRYAKKFDFFWENIKMYACTGCGRCYESCIGNIDIRHILKTVVEELDESSKKS